MKLIGQFIFALILPVFRLYLKGSQRAYVIVQVDGQVLLSKNWIGRQKWQLPGGGVKKTENLEQAASRELKEEAGIDIVTNQLKKITDGIWQTDRLGYAYHIFNIKLSDKPPVKQLYPEIIETAWVEPRELNAQNTTTEVLAAIRLAGLL